MHVDWYSLLALLLSLDMLFIVVSLLPIRGTHCFDMPSYKPSWIIYFMFLGLHTTRICLFSFSRQFQIVILRVTSLCGHDSRITSDRMINSVHRTNYISNYRVYLLSVRFTTIQWLQTRHKLIGCIDFLCGLQVEKVDEACFQHLTRPDWVQWGQDNPESN